MSFICSFVFFTLFVFLFNLIIYINNLNRHKFIPLLVFINESREGVGGMNHCEIKTAVMTGFCGNYWMQAMQFFDNFRKHTFWSHNIQIIDDVCLWVTISNSRLVGFLFHETQCYLSSKIVKIMIEDVDWLIVRQMRLNSKYD